MGLWGRVLRWDSGVGFWGGTLGVGFWGGTLELGSGLRLCRSALGWDYGLSSAFEP